MSHGSGGLDFGVNGALQLVRRYKRFGNGFRRCMSGNNETHSLLCSLKC